MEHENATAHTAEQTKVKNFVIDPQNKKELDCRPFQELFDGGVLDKGKCTGTASTSSARSWKMESAGWTLAVAAAVSGLLAL